jgi:hypothetical protein
VRSKPFWNPAVSGIAAATVNHWHERIMLSADTQTCSASRSLLFFAAASRTVLGRLEPQNVAAPFLRLQPRDVMIFHHRPNRINSGSYRSRES